MKLPKMKTPWRLAIPALGALIVLILATVTGGSASGHLPKPPLIASGPGGSSISQQHRAQVFTPGTAVPLTGCSLSTSQSGLAGRNGEIAIVKTAPGAWVKLQAHYSRYTSVHAGQADNGGTATFGLDNPPTAVAETVRLTATATLQKQEASCQGSFTPRAAVLGCSVWVSNPAPAPGPTTEVVTVRTTPGASVRLTASYIRFTSVHRRQAANGEAYFYLTIAHATPGYRVQVTAAAYLWSAASYCSTSFTPT